MPSEAPSRAHRGRKQQSHGPSAIRPLALAFCSVVALSAARADTIHLVDGTTLEDVEVLAEALDGVTWRRQGKGGEERLEAERVLAIERVHLPPALEQAERAIQRGSIEQGIELLAQFAASALQGSRRAKQDWAPAHALDRALRLQLAREDFQGAIASADLLWEKLSLSRQVPATLLAKAEAQRALGDAAGAQATQDALRDLIVARRLSERWTLELELARIQGYAELTAQARRDRFGEIADRASAWPPVRNRARLLEAASLLDGERPDFSAARALLAEILASPIADDATLAAANAGLGDCLMQAASEKLESGADASADLRAALLAYMRVVVLHADQSAVAAKCTFLAARACDQLGDGVSKANARRLRAALIQRHPNSAWAAEARNLRR
jgi:hypothetical protein